MNINYDKVADVVYFRVSKKKIAKTLKMNDRLIVDLDGAGNIVGIEILDASSQQDLIASLENEMNTGVPISILSKTPTAA